MIDYEDERDRPTAFLRGGSVRRACASSGGGGGFLSTLRRSLRDRNPFAGHRRGQRNTDAEHMPATPRLVRRANGSSGGGGGSLIASDEWRWQAAHSAAIVDSSLVTPMPRRKFESTANRRLSRVVDKADAEELEARAEPVDNVQAPIWCRGRRSTVDNASVCSTSVSAAVDAQQHQSAMDALLYGGPAQANSPALARKQTGRSSTRIKRWPPPRSAEPRRASDEHTSVSTDEQLRRVPVASRRNNRNNTGAQQRAAPSELSSRPASRLCTDAVSLLQPSPAVQRRGRSPPSAETAARDIYAHVRRLLTPQPVRRLQHNSSSNGAATAAGSLALGSGASGRMGNSQQSSMVSLLHTNSPQCNPGGNMRSKFRSNSSQASSRSSYMDLMPAPSVMGHNYHNNSNNAQYPPSVASSRRSYPLNGLLPRANARASSVISGASGHRVPTAKRPLSSLPSGVTVKCDWEVPVPTDGCEQPFVGRDWLFRDVHEALLRPTVDNDAIKAVVVSGSSGSGKTSMCSQLALHSPFFTSADATPAGKQNAGGTGSAGDSGYGAASGSRLSLHSAHTPPPYGGASCGRAGDWLRVCASRVAAYHFCRADDSRSCSLHHVVASLAGQLAQSPLVGHAYSLALANAAAADGKLRAALDPDDCDAARVEPGELFTKLICHMLAGVKPADNQPIVIVLDGLDEAEFHRTETGVSVATVLAAHCRKLPPHVRLVLTVSSDKRCELAGSVPARPLSLDDAETDERVWRDAKDYVDWRLAVSANLQQHLLHVTNVPLGEDPLEHFACHVTSASGGNLLYLRLVIDLIECGSLRLKSANYSVLPTSLSEVYLLMVNLRYPSGRAFESAAPILSLVLASLRPLTGRQVLDAYNAGRCKDPLDAEQFEERLALLDGLLVRRQAASQTDAATLCLAHASLRQWLVRDPAGRTAAHRFLVDASTRDAFLR